MIVRGMKKTVVGYFGGAKLLASLLDRNFLAVLGSRGRSPPPSAGKAARYLCSVKNRES